MMKSLISKLKDQQGISVIMVALMIVMFLSLAALAIDIGYGLVVKNELQNISDAAALAATRQLGSIYEGMSYEEQQTYFCDSSTIIGVAKEVAENNQAGGQSITINDGDVIIGTWNVQTKLLNPTFLQPDAVRVIARRDDVANGPITTFFARIFGKDTVDVSADAIAALTGLSIAGEGGLPFPGGISKYRFETEYCDKPIRFYPTNDLLSCGGWHTYTESPSSANKLSNILKDLKDRKYKSPETIAGETKFDFTGGTLASVFDDMKALFDVMKVKNDGELDKDNNPDTWTTTVVVYDSPDCFNPNKPLKIVGFAEITITEILEAPEKIINGVIKCEYVESGRGGGGEYGTKGSIPGLVE